MLNRSIYYYEISWLGVRQVTGKGLSKERGHDDFDLFFKELFKKHGTTIMSLISGNKFINLQPLQKELRARKRRVDFLATVEIERDGRVEERLLHVEFQRSDDSNMALRMLEYGAMILTEHGLKPLIQVVFYLGDKPSSMKNELKIDSAFSMIHSRYMLVELWKMDPDVFLSIDDPEINLLAMLTDCSIAKKEEILEKILSAAIKRETRERDQLLLELEAMLKLRKLTNMFKKVIKKMAIDIKESIIFKEGLKEGMEKGKKEGLKEGLIQAILLDLKIKFDIDKNTETKINNALRKIDDLKKLWELKKAALVANTLDDFIDQL